MQHVHVGDHPDPLLFTVYCLNKENLSAKAVALIENHLKFCRRCRSEAEDSIGKRGFFRSQKTVLGDCD